MLEKVWGGGFLRGGRFSAVGNHHGGRKVCSKEGKERNREWRV